MRERSACLRKAKQTPRRAELANRDAFPRRHIRQSSSQHGDAASGLMQIFSEVTFSADTSLSLQTWNPHPSAGVTDLQIPKHALPFVKSGAECQLVTLEVAVTWVRSVAILPIHR